MSKAEATEESRGAGRRRRGRPTRANGVATRERLIQAATTLFAAGGYEATSLRQIALRAEVDIATLKYHFKDKPDLFAEAYRVQHQDFIDFIGPRLRAMVDISTTEEVKVHIGDLVRGCHDFIEAHMSFGRMILYRFLEDASDVIGLEDELQVVAIDMIAGAFEVLQGRGLLRPVDARAFVIHLINSFPMWFVIGKVRPRWFGAPGLYTPAGRARSEAFFTDMLCRALVP